jgi:DNA processing protein
MAWFDGIPWQLAGGRDFGRPQLESSTLYWCGRLPLPPGPRVAVVGSRAATDEQCLAARQVAELLVAAGAHVWSGGARGVDSEALAAASTAGGVAVAVLPCAHDRPYPHGAEPLLAQVARAGGVLSAYTPGTAARTAQFHARNALLVQMVDAVLVVCADARSGTMATARKAWQARIPVAAMPWPAARANSAGVAQLIAAGCATVRDAESCTAFVERVGSGSPSTEGRGELPRPLPRKRPPRRPIDADTGASSCYAAPGPPRPLPLAPGWSSEELATVTAALPAVDTDGAGLEDLALTTGLERGRLANLLLLSAIAGAVERMPGGRWRGLN